MFKLWQLIINKEKYKLNRGFSDAQFLRENSLARKLSKMEETFFTGKTKYETLSQSRIIMMP